jgi:glutathione S-transferase
MTDVVLYGFAHSSFTWSTRIALEEKRVPHRLEPVEMWSEAHRALHPFKKIPILKHGDTTVFESSAIMRYADKRFDGPALQPADPMRRVRMEQWLSAHNDYFVETVLGVVIYQRIIVPNFLMGTPDEAAIAEAMPRVRELLAIIDGALADSDYFAGPEVSLADFMYLPTLGHLAGVPEGRGLLDGYPNLKRWSAAMNARPSVAATQPAPQQAAAA